MLSCENSDQLEIFRDSFECKYVIVIANSELNSTTTTTTTTTFDRLGIWEFTKIYMLSSIEWLAYSWGLSECSCVNSWHLSSASCARFTINKWKIEHMNLFWSSNSIGKLQHWNIYVVCGEGEMAVIASAPYRSYLVASYLLVWCTCLQSNWSKNKSKIVRNRITETEVQFIRMQWIKVCFFTWPCGQFRTVWLGCFDL